MSNELPESDADRFQPTGAYERINSLCESFSQEWQSAARPAFDDYLKQVAEDAQPTLLRNLLHIEIQRRRTAGEQPSVEEYLQKFPRLAGLIRQVFFESSAALTTGHELTPGAKPAVCKAPHRQPPGRVPSAARVGPRRQGHGLRGRPQQTRQPKQSGEWGVRSGE